MRRISRKRSRHVRLTVGLRLLLALAGLVSFSTAVALALQDRALARDLEQAASERLDRAASAARRLVRTHVESLEERYRAISGTPQLRANLEVQHAPTLAFYAGDLQRREGARLLAFVDREGRVIASAGDDRLLSTAIAATRSGLTAHAGEPCFVTLSELRTSLGSVGRLVAVDGVPPELVASWSELCGAPLAFASPTPGGDMARDVASLPGVTLRVAADLRAEREALRHSRANLLIAGCASLALSLLASAAFARSFVSPIRAIQHAAERVRGGDLTGRIGSERLDEIGDVARAFDAMQEHLQSSRAQVEASFDELSRSRAHLDNAQRSARIGSFEVDLSSGLVEASRQLRELYRLSQEEKPIDPAQLLERIHPDDRADVEEALSLATRQGHAATFDYRVRLPDGEERLLHGEVRVVRDVAGQPIRMEGTAQDVTDWRRAEEQIRFLAYHDGLTGLGNRRLFTERARVAIENARRRDTSLGVIFLDLDWFKRINDTLGHTIGDELLRAVAERLSHCVRATDIVSRAGADHESAISRFGGDEFTILIEQVEDPQRLSLVASRILAMLETPFELGGHELVVGASIGIAAWPLDGDDAEALLRNADAAMYHAKEHGRNQYQFYTDSMNAAALERLQLEQRMRTGLLRGELEVHYQPKLDLASETVTGFEALVRWRDPERGMVLPGAFIPVAEQSGMIVEIGRRVLELVCEQIARWEEAGRAGIERVSVNVSARQFEGGELVETVRQALERSGAPAERLELEITEGTVMRDERSVIAALLELRALGVSISLDDFGTGYSSLSYLRSLPVDTLKIDMAFVRNIASNPEDAALSAAIVAMGKARGLRVVAEGVESPEQRRLLRGFGCDEIQGFLISPALPADEAAGVRGASFAEGDPITQSSD